MNKVDKIYKEGGITYIVFAGKVYCLVDDITKKFEAILKPFKK